MAACAARGGTSSEPVDDDATRRKSIENHRRVIAFKQAMLPSSVTPLSPPTRRSSVSVCCLNDGAHSTLSLLYDSLTHAAGSNAASDVGRRYSNITSFSLSLACRNDSTSLATTTTTTTTTTILSSDRAGSLVVH